MYSRQWKRNLRSAFSFLTASHSAPIKSKVQHPPGQTSGIWLLSVPEEWGIWRVRPSGGEFDLCLRGVEKPEPQVERFKWIPSLIAIRELTQQDSWKTQDGRMTKTCGARLCIPYIVTRHFFVILSSWVFQPAWCLSSLLLERKKRENSDTGQLKVSRTLIFFQRVRPLIESKTKCSNIIGC